MRRILDVGGLVSMAHHTDARSEFKNLEGRGFNQLYIVIVTEPYAWLQEPEAVRDRPSFAVS